jgi:hypothetical protein
VAEKVDGDKIFAYHNGYAQFEHEGRYGVFDTEKRVIVPPEYENIYYEAIQDVFFVKQGGLTGLINVSGEVICECKYIWGGFRPQKDSDLFFYMEDRLYGCFNIMGEVVYPPQWKEVEDFTNGMALVSNGYAWGAISSDGQTYLPEKWFDMFEFSPIGAVVNRKGMWGVMDKQGDMIIDIYNSPYSYLSIESDGLRIAKNQNGKYGYINLEAKIVIPFIWDDANWFSEGLANVRLAENCYVINTKGEVLFHVDCKWLGLFVEDRAFFLKDGKYGVIDTHGRIVAEPIWDTGLWLSCEYSEGYAMVWKEDSGYSFIDKDGGFPFNRYWNYAYDFSEGYACVQDFDGSFYYINKNGKEISTQRYEYAESFVSGTAYVEIDGAKYRINSSFEIICAIK